MKIGLMKILERAQLQIEVSPKTQMATFLMVDWKQYSH